MIQLEKHPTLKISFVIVILTSVKLDALHNGSFDRNNRKVFHTIQHQIQASVNDTHRHQPQLNDSRISEMEISEELPQGDQAERGKVKGPEFCEDEVGSPYDSLSCRNVKSFHRVLDYIVDKKDKPFIKLEIVDSDIPVLNLTMLNKYPSLRNISITHSGLTTIVGKLPKNVAFLNFSRNRLNLSALHETFSGDEVKVQIIDLSYNNVDRTSELPKSILMLRHLTALYLAGNRFDGYYVWSTMWDWINGSTAFLRDADYASCVFNETKKPFSLEGCLRAKKDFEETCNRVDFQQCSCSLYGLQKDLEYQYPEYPISHKGVLGSIAISLFINCSQRGLRTFPSGPLPVETWRLDLSHNRLEDLSPIKSLPYLIYLDATNNSVKIETLLGTPFMKGFMSLSLQHNNIRHLPSEFLKAVKNIQHHNNNHNGDTFLGDNFLDCDCPTAKETKPLLNSIKNPDWKEIYCGNMWSPNGQFLPLRDLKLVDVCLIPKESDPDQQYWIYIIIGAEALLILVIVGKVWVDQRRFRRTGKLPWCSQKIPRLPCDAILEGIKDRRNTNANGGSSSSNNHHSQSSVHRTNSNAGSGSARSNPGSSRFNLAGVHGFMRSSRSNSDGSQGTSIHGGDVEGSSLLGTGR